jgi:hypothetical protein
VASDVYSLAATIWHLLAGRSPFASPGGPNQVTDLVHRITNTPVAATGRPDVPRGLERLLASAMSKDPADRPRSALELARSLQAVEKAAGYAETSVDILEDRRSAPRPDPVDDEPGTRIRGLVTVDPDGAPTNAGAALSPGPERTIIRSVLTTGPTSSTLARDTPVVEERTRSRGVPSGPPLDDTRIRARTTSDQPVPDAAPPAVRGRRPWIIGSAAAVVVAGAVTAVVLSGGSGGTPPSQAPTAATDGGGGAPAVDAVVPTPTGLSGSRQGDGSIVFTWQTPDPSPGDQWVIRRTDPGADGGAQLVSTASFTVTGEVSGQKACVSVAVRRQNGQTSATPATSCAG